MAELDGPRARTLAGRRSSASPERDRSVRMTEATARAIARFRSAGPRRHRREGRGRRAARASTTACGCSRRRTCWRVGWLANRERERRHGDRTYFNHNIRARGDERLRGELPVLLVRAPEARRRRAPTRCRSRRRGTSCARAPTSRSPKSTSSTACTRICRSATTRSCCAGFKRIRPGIHLKCFTAVEIAFFADIYGMTDRAGARASCVRPASIRCPAAAPRSSRARVRQKICHDKCDGDRWLDDPPHRAPAGDALERDDALRAHRDARGARRSHAARARAAGRDRRVPGLHPARVSPRQQPDAQAARADRRPTRCACTPWRA